METVNLSAKVKTLLVFEVSQYTKIRLVRTYAKVDREPFTSCDSEYAKGYKDNPSLVCRDTILISRYDFGGDEEREWSTDCCDRDSSDSDEDLQSSVPTLTPQNGRGRLFAVNDTYTVTNSVDRQKKIAFMTLSVDDLYTAASAAQQDRAIVVKSSDGRTLSTQPVSECTVICCPRDSVWCDGPVTETSSSLFQVASEGLNALFPDAIWLNTFELNRLYRAAKTVKLASKLNSLVASVPPVPGLLFGGFHELGDCDLNTLDEIFHWVAAGVIVTCIRRHAKDICRECRSGKPLVHRRDLPWCRACMKLRKQKPDEQNCSVGFEATKAGSCRNQDLKCDLCIELELSRLRHSCDKWFECDGQKVHHSNELKHVLDNPETKTVILRLWNLLGFHYNLPETYIKTYTDTTSDVFREATGGRLTLSFVETWLSPNNVINRQFAEFARCIVADMKRVDW